MKLREAEGVEFVNSRRIPWRFTLIGTMEF